MKVLRKFILISLIILFCMTMVGYGCRATSAEIPEFTFDVTDNFAVILNVSGSKINGFVSDISYDPTALQYITYSVLSTNPFPFYAIHDSSGLVQGVFGYTGTESIATINANIFEAAFKVVKPCTTYVKLTKAIGYESLNNECGIIQIENEHNVIILKEPSIPTDESVIIFKLIFEKR